MVDISATPIGRSIAAILSDTKDGLSSYEIDVKISTPTETITVLNMVECDIQRDYLKNFSDVILLKVTLLLGVYVKRVYPNRDNLEVTITKTYTKQVNRSRMTNAPKDVTTYKAVVLPGQVDVTNTIYGTMDETTLNNSPPLELVLQLLDKTAEAMRVLTVSGVYTNIATINLVRFLLSTKSSSVLVDGKPSYDLLDVIPDGNQERRAHVVLKDGTRLIDVVAECQNNHGGVYPAGAGLYLQKYNNKRTWFVYPLFDTGGYTGTKPKAIFYTAINNKAKYSEKTFRVDGFTTHILVTGDNAFVDDGEAAYNNNGSGFRMLDARPLLLKPVTITPDGPKGTPDGLVHSVSAISKRDGITLAPMTSRVSSNPFVEYSKVLASSGGYYRLTWENANADLIYPGMPCRIMYFKDSVTKYIDGVIIGTDTIIGSMNTNLYNVDQSVTTMVTVFAKKNMDNRI